jgi:hypothetical protein
MVLLGVGSWWFPRIGRLIGCFDIALPPWGLLRRGSAVVRDLILIGLCGLQAAAKVLLLLATDPLIVRSVVV